MTAAIHAGNVEAGEDLESILDTVRRQTGLTLPARTAPAATIRREMRLARVSNPAEYARLIAARKEMFDSLVTALTVGETYFMREREQLEFIGSSVVPELLRDNKGKPLTAWSAACAQGEEAYSLAMVAREADTVMRVLGTDISVPRLEHARTGLYGEWSFRGVAPEIRARYFRRSRERHEVLPAIRARVEFRHLNLAGADWSAAEQLAPFDLVLCRNALIYLDARTVARVARRLMSLLTPSGWLFLGASDPLLSGMVPCEVVLTGAGIAYRRVQATDERRRDAFTARLTAAPTPVVARPQRSTLPAVPKRLETGTARSRESAPPSRKVASPGLASVTEAYARRDYAAAADGARQHVAAEPGDASGWIILVRALANLGRMQEAGIACAAAHDLHRGSAELAYLHGLLLREGGRIDDAMAALRSAVYLDRQLAIGHLTLGDMLASMGETANALRAFRNAERLLARMPADATVPATDGLQTGALRHLARGRLEYWQDSPRPEPVGTQRG